MGGGGGGGGGITEKTSTWKNVTELKYTKAV